MAQFFRTGREKKTPEITETHREVSQTSLWSRLTNSRLLTFLYSALFPLCYQSNCWNVTGNDRNISIYSRSRANRLKQLLGLQLSVCTNVPGRIRGCLWHAEHPFLKLVELAQASWELCATKRRTRLCLVRSGHVWTASVTGLVPATGNASVTLWNLQQRGANPADLTYTLTTLHFLSNRKKWFW